MTIDPHLLLAFFGGIVSMIAENLKIVQNPDTDDQTKMAIVAVLSLAAAIVAVIGQHLMTAPTALLTWTDIYMISQSGVEILLASQAYHVGWNRLVDAWVSSQQSKARAKLAKAEAMPLTEKGLA